MTELTKEIVRELLHYAPETGHFTWKERDRNWFHADQSWKTWNTRYSGKRAGTASSYMVGYINRQIRLLGQNYYEHRLAWIWMTDEPLPLEIDHINRIGTDNRWKNIRSSSHTKNQHNLSLRIDNTSGITGVSLDKRRNKWMARSWLNGKCRNLGGYEYMEDAAAAVQAFRAAHGFDPMHGAEIAHYHTA